MNCNNVEVLSTLGSFQPGIPEGHHDRIEFFFKEDRNGLLSQSTDLSVCRSTQLDQQTIRAPHRNLVKPVPEDLRPHTRVRDDPELNESRHGRSINVDRVRKHQSARAGGYGKTL